MTHRFLELSRGAPTGRLPLVLLVCAVLAAACEHDAGSAHGSHAHDADHAPTASSHDAQGDRDPAAGTGHDEHGEEVRLMNGAAARSGIRTRVAERAVLRPTLHAPARVGFDTEAMAHVGSPLRGRIVEVRVRIGDEVKVGDPLAVVESPDLGEAQADYLQRRVAVQTAEPAVDLSRVAWERAQGLYERSRGLSLTEVQRREAEHKAAVAALKAAESARTAAANRLSLLGMDGAAIEALAATGEVVPRFTIRAAISGVVVQREVTLGELVNPEREYLMVLADASRLWVLADVPEARLREVRLGARAWVSVGSQGDAGHERASGSLTFLSPFVDPTTRTAQVRIEVPAGTLGLRPGMFAQVEIASSAPGADDETLVVVVPEEALQTIEGAPTVFVPVADEPDTFRKRVVEVGAPVDGLVPVRAGLAEGESYVSTGSFLLKAELLRGAASHAH